MQGNFHGYVMFVVAQKKLESSVSIILAITTAINQEPYH